jgi:hypothetical protein
MIGTIFAASFDYKINRLLTSSMLARIVRLSQGNPDHIALAAFASWGGAIVATYKGERGFDAFAASERSLFAACARENRAGSIYC